MLGSRRAGFASCPPENGPLKQMLFGLMCGGAAPCATHVTTNSSELQGWGSAWGWSWGCAWGWGCDWEHH